MNSIRTRPPLPPANCYIHILGIDLNAITDTAYAFGSNQRAAGTEERIEDNVAASRAIEDRIGEQLNGFHGRVQGQQPSSPPFERLLILGYSQTFVRFRPKRPSCTLLRWDSLPLRYTKINSWRDR